MKIVVLYHPGRERAREVEEYVARYSSAPGRTIDVDLLSLETIEGARIAKLYDVTSYPALLLVDTRGQMLKLWQGEQLPAYSEIASYNI